MAEKTVFKTLQHIFSDTKEQTVEAELVLPDYYPEVSQIIKCSACPAVEAVTVSGDRISVAGDLCVRIIFVGEDKSINTFETHQKYTKVIKAELSEGNDNCFVRQHITSVNYRATAPRRIEVRAQIAVKTDCCRVCEQELAAVSNEDGIEQHINTFDCFNVSTLQKVSFETSDALTVEGRKPGAVVTDVSGSAVLTEKKVIKNKIMLRGTCEIKYTLIYSDSTRFEKGSVSLPFTGITDVFGLEEDDDCSVNVMCINPEINLKDSDGENRPVEVSAVIEAEIIGGKSLTVEYTDDVYSVNCDVKAELCDVSYVKSVNRINESITDNAEAECYDEQIAEICCAFSDALRINSVLNNGKCSIEGGFVCNAVIKNQAGDMRLISKSIAFDKEIEAENAASVFLDASVSSLRCTLFDGTKLRINAEICVSGFYVCCNTCCAAVNIISDTENSTASCGSENIVLYYASKGESLWSIAKENKGKCDTIKELNGLSEDVISENRVLVFPCGKV